MRRLLAAAGALFAAMAIAAPLPRAAAALDLPWPDAATEAGPEGRDVTFASHSPFALSDVGKGAERDPPTEATGTLFLPRGVTARIPVPAVVLLHGAGGMMDPRELTYGRQFAARGVAALAVDVFASRRDRATGFINRLLEITEAMFLADAFSALRYLAARSEIDGRRIVLIGFSYGGMASTYAAYAQVAEIFARNGERFAGHVAFYAPCIAEFEDSRATGAPLLMLYGGRDQIVDPARCDRVARQLERGGGRVQTVVYPEAVHQWDGWYGGERRMGRNLAGCRFIVEPDGTVRDRQLLVPMSSPLLRKMMLGICTDEEGYLLGRNDAIRTRSNRDLGRFLQRVFDRRG